MKRKLVIVGGIFVAIAFVISLIYLSYKSKPPVTPLAITSSTPTNNSLGVSVFDPLTIQFNMPIVVENLSVTSEPSEDWTVSQLSGDTIQLAHKLYLHVATHYTITVSQNGTVAGTLSFETAAEQNDPRMLQGLQADLDKNYPLAKYTPYETPLYRVVYSSPLTLQITLKTFDIDENSAIAQIQTWVQLRGVDPATHKYTVILPSPTPEPSVEPSPSIF